MRLERVEGELVVLGRLSGEVEELEYLHSREVKLDIHPYLVGSLSPVNSNPGGTATS